MQSKSFKDRIAAELDSSYDFIKESLNCMKSYPQWSGVLKSISDSKYENAKQLYRMFMDLYMDSTDHDAYMDSLRDAIVEMFSVKTRMIDGYLITYDMINIQEPEEKQNERDTADRGNG